MNEVERLEAEAARSIDTYRRRGELTGGSIIKQLFNGLGSFG